MNFKRYVVEMQMPEGYWKTKDNYINKANKAPRYTCRDNCGELSFTLDHIYALKNNYLYTFILYYLTLYKLRRYRFSLKTSYKVKITSEDELIIRDILE